RGRTSVAAGGASSSGALGSARERPASSANPPAVPGNFAPARPRTGPGQGVRSPPVKTQSIRLRGGVARVAAWHGRSDVANVALQCRGAPAADEVELLIDELRIAGYRAVLTNALAPGASLPFVDCGFEVRGRLHLLALDFAARPLAPSTRRTRRVTAADRPALLAVDAAAFDDFWTLDDVGLEQAERATPRSHMRVERVDPIGGYGLF